MQPRTRGDHPCFRGAYILGELRLRAQENKRGRCLDLGFIHTGVLMEALGMDQTTWRDVEWKRRGPCVGHTGLEEGEDTAKEYEKELPSFHLWLLWFLKLWLGSVGSMLKVRCARVLRLPDDSWCGAVFFQVAGVLRRISIPARSHFLSLLPSPKLCLAEISSSSPLQQML